MTGCVDKWPSVACCSLGAQPPSRQRPVASGALPVPTDINECVTDLHTCSRGEHCVNTLGSFRCHKALTCQPGYALEDGECTGEHRGLGLSPGPPCRSHELPALGSLTHRKPLLMMVFGAEGVSEADAPGFLHFLVSHCHLSPHRASLPLSRCWGGAPPCHFHPFRKILATWEGEFSLGHFHRYFRASVCACGVWVAGYVVGDDVPATDLLMRDMGPHRKQEDGRATSGRVLQ